MTTKRKRKVTTLSRHEAQAEIDGALDPSPAPWDLLPVLDENPGKQLLGIEREIRRRTAFGLFPLPPEGPCDDDYEDDP